MQMRCREEGDCCTGQRLQFTLLTLIIIQLCGHLWPKDEKKCILSVCLSAILKVPSIFDDYRDNSMNCDYFGEVDDNVTFSYPSMPR